MNRATILFWLTIMLLPLDALAADRVEIRRLPDGAIQPRLASHDGLIHLVYFQRETTGSRFGGLMHKTIGSGDADWGEPVSVSPRFRHNDQIGKADFAIDGEGRVHVAWFQSDPAGYFYTRSIDGGKSFAAPRALVFKNIEGVEAEPSVAATGDQVVVAWHAGSMLAEHQRRVYVVLSDDGGETFSEEIAASKPGLGVCACCAMASGFDENGNYSLAYRSAVDGTGRHMQVMADGRTSSVGDWELDYCPVTSAAMNRGWLAFETDGRLYRWHPKALPQAEPLTTAAARARQKHPSIAVNDKEEVLYVWGEAGGYSPGGKINMRLAGPAGSTTSINVEDLEAIPEFSVAAAVARSDSTFLVIY